VTYDPTGRVRKLRQRIPCYCAGLVLAACTQTNAALMDNSIHLARTCPDAVKIYTSPSTVRADYQEIALLNSAGLTSWTTESGMMKSMRQKAAEVGASGIIMGNIDEPGAGAKVAAQVFGAYTERKGKSVAIYVPSDEPRVRAVCKGSSAVTQQASAVQSRAPEVTPTAESHVMPLNRSVEKVASEAPSRRAETVDPGIPSGNYSQALIGAPRSESDRDAGARAFAEGNAYIGSHEWSKAEQSFQQAILYDGSVAQYHAAMGALMMLLHRWVDAEASYSAAVLLDVDNVAYRQKLKEARARR
jgi:hypothetical protein